MDPLAAAGDPVDSKRPTSLVRVLDRDLGLVDRRATGYCFLVLGSGGRLDYLDANPRELARRRTAPGLESELSPVSIDKSSENLTPPPVQ